MIESYIDFDGVDDDDSKIKIEGESKSKSYHTKFNAGVTGNIILKSRRFH